MTDFIDFHVHPPVPGLWDGPFAPYVPHLERTFGRALPMMSPEQLADYYRASDARAVVLGWDAETATGLPPFSNKQVAGLVATAPGVFIGFGSVDPHKGAAAVSAIHEAAQLGLLGLKLHPPAQRFDPGDERHWPIFEAAAEHELVVLTHTGYTGLGAGMRGGARVELAYGNPMRFDRVASRFPSLRIVLAHPSWPWQQEAIAVAQHKPNVFLELSGWSPKYVSDELLAAVRRTLHDRTLFGTDFPFLTPDRWLRDWREIVDDESLTQKIVHDNAARLLGIESTAGEDENS